MSSFRAAAIAAVVATVALIYLCIDFVECTLERGIDGAETRKYSGEARAQEAVVDASEEQGRAETEFGEAIAEAVGPALDQAVQAQTT